jgi:RNA polymerase sigma-70 factor (ECF subfamily)
MGGLAALHKGPDFRVIFEENVDYVWRVLRHLAVPSSDIEDVAQEVFVVVHRRLSDYRPDHPIRSWLYVICRNAARDRRRRAHVRLEKASETVPERGLAATPVEELEATQALERIHAALSNVDDTQREVFLMYELEGIPMADIAHAVGCPLKTGYSRLRLAREQVRVALGLEGEEPGDE